MQFKPPLLVMLIACSCLLELVTLGQETSDKLISTIAFGSCARERQNQPVWNDIVATKPDLFLMIGDNQYADFWMKNGEMVMQPVPNVERIREAYDGLGAQPGFNQLKQHCELMATWDDHDYGANDSGNDFEFREQSQQEFIRFFGFGLTHPIRNQQGVYHSKTFGPANRRTQIIMLDTRFHRDPLERTSNNREGKGPYQPTTDVNKTVLGAAQWRWLEEQLRQPAAVRIIASSIQVVADEHGWETWGNFPHERRRLYELIKSTGAQGVLIVSGDRHLMEISCDDQNSPGYPIWDFTSSGLTQKSKHVVEQNRHRIGPVKREQNFGVIRIDWRQRPESTRLHLEGFGAGGKLLTRQTILLNSLHH